MSTPIDPYTSNHKGDATGPQEGGALSGNITDISITDHDEVPRLLTAETVGTYHPGSQLVNYSGGVDTRNQRYARNTTVRRRRKHTVTRHDCDRSTTHKEEPFA